MTDTLVSQEGAMQCRLQTEFTGRRSMAVNDFAALFPRP